MPKKKHKDTAISLHPLSFEDAIEALASSPKSEDSPPESAVAAVVGYNWAAGLLN